MPIYEFKCETCDFCFEKLVFLGDEKHIICPECGGKQIKKMMSVSNFSGFGIGNADACGAGSSGGFS